ncbi:MAG: alpha/beta hydrolase [Hyphomicrobiales bacterium]|nr:alpha/beta hydrolase [Hyphomicrobiales bacterium]MDE2016506.1 alpha/beta hydrolase [Hyphomicrobiales bacterium]
MLNMRTWRGAMVRVAFAFGAAILAGCAGTTQPQIVIGSPEATKAGDSLVAFAHTPFPYDGAIPDTGKPFLDVNQDGRRGHTSPRGGVYWEDETYSDRRVLTAIPETFDIRAPGALVVFFHGNQATLERDVLNRQQVPWQVAHSGLNAVLVAPQFAVDALDSSAGNFWTPGYFRAFLDETSRRLAKTYGGGAAAERAFARMPVILVVYSGGYYPAAYSLATAGSRVRGVILLDGVYGNEDKFANWIEDNRDRAFFFSAYSQSSKDSNDKIRALLDADHVPYASGLPDSLGPGVVSFLDAGQNLNHLDFVTQAWTGDPLQAALSRVIFGRAEPKIASK